MTLNRRQMLFATGAALVGAPAMHRAVAADKGSPKKVLFYTKSSGFEHSVIARKDGKLGLAERILTEIGKEHGFEVVASKDGRMFDPGQIGQWDAFAFETTGVLTTMGDHTDGEPMSVEGKQAFLEAIRGGKGFVGMHCASDTFHSPKDHLDPYIEMIGGEFIRHGTQQKAQIDVVDPAFAGAGAYGSSFAILEEWYALKNFQDDLHVIMVQNTKDMDKKVIERFFDLRLMSSLKDVSGIPTVGKNLIIVAAVNDVLHFRIFDGASKMVVDTEEKQLSGKAQLIEDLRKQLEGLWAPHVLTKSDKDGVIAVLTSIVGHTSAKDKGNVVYDRPNFPETWVRMHGKGRVFYTSMGHREDVWASPLYQGLLIGALNWATGKVDASIEPNISQVTPEYKTLHPGGD